MSRLLSFVLLVGVVLSHEHDKDEQSDKGQTRLHFGSGSGSKLSQSQQDFFDKVSDAFSHASGNRGSGSYRPSGGGGGYGGGRPHHSGNRPNFGGDRYGNDGYDDHRGSGGFGGGRPNRPHQGGGRPSFGSGDRYGNDDDRYGYDDNRGSGQFGGRPSSGFGSGGNYGNDGDRYGGQPNRPPSVSIPIQGIVADRPGCVYWDREKGTGKPFCADGDPIYDKNTGHRVVAEPIVKRGYCPKVRGECPSTRFLQQNRPTKCADDSNCFKREDKCCYDECLKYNVCKPRLSSPVDLHRDRDRNRRNKNRRNNNNRRRNKNKNNNRRADVSY